jgi:Fic family protein
MYLGVEVFMKGFDIVLTAEILSLISEIDEFRGSWKALKNLKPELMYSLKLVATIESIGSSTRIEGVKLTDSEIEKLLKGLNTHSFSSRDEEEVAGYSEAMSMVFESFKDIDLTENHIKQLHQVLLKFSSKDVRHCGEYKKFPNHVEAFDRDGVSIGVVFETATPFETPAKMEELVKWAKDNLNKKESHPLIVIAVFIVHFLAIHPFQDGNGRLSRILTTLLLLRSSYEYIPYSSLEKVVEANKSDYYLALRQTQGDPKKNMSVWIIFFLKMMKKHKDELLEKLEKEHSLMRLPELSIKILKEIKERGTATISEIELLTKANRNTIKAHLKKLVKDQLLEMMGIGKGAKYRGR